MEEEKKTPEIAKVLPMWAAQLLQRAAVWPNQFERQCRIDAAIAEVRRQRPELFKNHG